MNDLFANIGAKNKEKLLKMLTASTVKFPKGINILTYQNKRNYIGIIEKGSLQINIVDYKGNTVILDELKTNDIFGTMIYPLTDEYDAITKEDTTIIFIDYQQVVNLEGNNSEYFYNFIRNLFTILGNLINIKNERIKILTKRTTRDKILEYLNNLSKEKGSKTFTLPFKYTDLANYLCCDRAAMSREFKYLKDEGFIKTKGKNIKLLY